MMDLPKMKQMNFVASLYDDQNRSYDQKCVYDVLNDLDLDLDAIFMKIQLY